MPPASPPAPRLAKLSPPRLVRVVARKRLFARLDEALAHPALWITGPPGSGKTTLAASYLAAHKRSVLWYQVDPGDGDIASFFHYLGVAIRQVARRANATVPAFGPEHRSHAAGFARRFFREAFALLPQGGVIVLDNAQEADSAEFRGVLQAMLEEIPDRASVIVTSRSTPPPELTAAIARRLLSEVDAGELAFTLPESTLLLAQRKLDAETVARIQRDSEGWAAGVVLLGGHAGSEGALEESAPARLSETLFAYFAGQAFDALAGPWQRFLMLTSLLPRVTASVGEATVTGVDARNVLETLHRKQLFVDRRSADEPTYQYHALFRDFLRLRATQAFTPAELREFQRRAGEHFEQRGWLEDAIPLLIDAQAYAAAAPLIAALAGTLLAQGRNHGLERWIARIPERDLEENPLLSYWLGHARIPRDEPSARAAFRTAFEGFARRKDDLGCLLAAAASLEVVYSSFRSWDGVGEWLEAVPLYYRRVQRYPDASTELRALSGYLLALHVRTESDDEALLETEAGVVALLRDEGIDANARLLTAGMLADLLDRLPDVDSRLTGFVAATRALVAKPGTSALLRARFLQVLAFQLAKARQFPAASAAFGEATAIREREELAQMDVELAFYESAIAFCRRDVEGSEAAAARMAAVHDPGNPVHAIFHAFTRGHLDLGRGDYAAAIGRIEEAIGHMRSVHAPPGEMPGAFTYLGCARLAHGDTSGATAAFAEALALRSGFAREATRCLLAFAQAHAQLADDADANLAEAFALARRLDFLRVLAPIPGVTAGLCAKALRLGIERDFVARVIDFQGLVPDSPHVEDWAWPVKVTTLGAFSVACEGKVELPGKAPKKPLELLKLVIASGGRPVSTQHAMEHLWPELEGDAARSALGVALHRLRKLLGREEAVTLDAGQLGLSKAHCWIDAMAFEHHLAQAEAHAQAHRLEAFEASAGAAMGLYAGHFLQGEDESAWLVGYRERLRSKHMRLTTLLGRHWLQQGEPEQALAAYQKALELDPLAEDVYRQLMLVLIALGRPAEALTVYRRCREMLSVVLGAKPSAETEQVHQSLRRSAT